MLLFRRIKGYFLRFRSCYAGVGPDHGKYFPFLVLFLTSVYIMINVILGVVVWIIGVVSAP